MSVTRKEQTHAASMVRAIAAGKWTNDAPGWANVDYWDGEHCGLAQDCMIHYTRAVQTAETFCIFFQALDPAFDQTHFLVACGLVDAPAKRR